MGPKRGNKYPVYVVTGEFAEEAKEEIAPRIVAEGDAVRAGVVIKACRQMCGTIYFGSTRQRR